MFFHFALTFLMSDTGKDVQFSKVYFTPLYSNSSIRLDNTKKDNLFTISSN